MTAQPWSPHELVYGLSAALEPQVSPDGFRIVYALGRADTAGAPPVAQLWVCGIDGSGGEPLTDADHRDLFPRWSPDGGQVAFVSDRVTERGLFTVSPGEAPVEVTHHRHPIEAPAWSQDGSRIAYVSLFDPADPEEAGPPEGTAPAVRVTRRLDYKEDVRGYLGDLRRQIFVVDAQGGRRRMVTSESVDHDFPRWSPDGRHLAFQTTERVGSHSWIEVLDVEASTVERVDLGDLAVLNLHAWSPSGSRLIMVGGMRMTGQPELYVYDFGSDRPRQVTDDLQVLPDAGYPSARPPSVPVWLDEKTVLLHAARAGAGGLYEVTVESGEVSPVTDWKAHHVGLSVDRSLRYLAQMHSDFERAGDVVVFDRERATTSMVTSHNAAAFEGRAATHWERLSVDREGFPIEAWLLFPPDFRSDRRYPVVLDIHGGPQGHYGYQFNQVQQCLASNGFLVLLVNPRGSTSYGRAFTEAVVHDWGGEDYWDLMAMLDLVVERPYVDPERLGAFGYSYGGYMTSWILGHTDRFHAVVCGAPCFNLVSMFGTSDISPFWGPLQWGARPYEDPEWYRTHSPSTYAHKARTPTLIVHGESDDRCPIGQGEEMFTALSQAGCEVQFARYPGASHLFPNIGFPGHREDFLQRILGWFDTHLGRGPRDLD
ncbi:MAG: S9 family peptidase [Candidatus Dormibacteraeota bacterium]|uniref:S9 family peptidase n=1 Tax=Candidatus Dormiibacter inghamiae TaxID=3127013 RepID=A0A934KGS5_9BACT|nr:S9 family peptidase [Candidatus Dormibacteraeota bacterium]MBJ7607664.1 S9 family peptidase [Candidatus Dormibacteraeota bacterium]